MTRSVDRPGSQGTGAAPSALVRYLAELAVLLVILTWGANVVMVKTAIRDVPPVLFAFVSFGTAFLALLAVLRWREGSVWLPRRDVLPMLLLGIAGSLSIRTLGHGSWTNPVSPACGVAVSPNCLAGPSPALAYLDRREKPV